MREGKAVAVLPLPTTIGACGAFEFMREDHLECVRLVQSDTERDAPRIPASVLAVGTPSGKQRSVRRPSGPPPLQKPSRQLPFGDHIERMPGVSED